MTSELNEDEFWQVVVEFVGYVRRNPDATGSLLADEGVDRLRMFQLDALEAARGEVERLREACANARGELSRWGWGDMHYGDQPQASSVVNAIRVCDAALASDTAIEGRET